MEDPKKKIVTHLKCKAFQHILVYLFLSYRSTFVLPLYVVFPECLYHEMLWVFFPTFGSFSVYLLIYLPEVNSIYGHVQEACSFDLKIISYIFFLCDDFSCVLFKFNWLFPLLANSVTMFCQNIFLLLSGYTVKKTTLRWVCVLLVILGISSVQFSRSVVSDSLRPHEPQHARPPCPSPTPGAYSNSCPSSRWCHPAISSSVVPFSSCPQSLLASGSFTMSQLLHEVAKVLEFQLQHQSFQWTPL